MRCSVAWPPGKLLINSKKYAVADAAHKVKKPRLHSIPVIDLFAGPGGLSEGFSSLLCPDGGRRFDVRVSIEKDPMAHSTLELRALFRAFPVGKVPDCYYDFLRGRISRDQLFNHPAAKAAADKARHEAKLAELGKTPATTVDGWIQSEVGEASPWVLIGGPPCQAYSLAGRARMSKRGKEFEKDARHFLYTEYLRIIQRFAPDVFIMENVKGLLTSKHSGAGMFDRILGDLRAPRPDLAYRIRSLVVPGEDVEPQDYVIKAEDYGIPQSRHRVILFGIREDVATRVQLRGYDPWRYVLRKESEPVTVAQALAGLPGIRSRISGGEDGFEEWRSILKKAPMTLKGWRHESRDTIEEAMQEAWRSSEYQRSTGAKYVERRAKTLGMPAELAQWYVDPALDGVLDHEARSHMGSDLHRYLFAACFARQHWRTPKLADFPPRLLPDHSNVTADTVPFVDRFRVQRSEVPSSTVVSHIAKDGHYYIHYDASQCRSLTVREAARLQTFPDNYYFVGGRTAQYHQVGNAVPPLLANKIAGVVSAFLADAS